MNPLSPSGSGHETYYCLYTKRKRISYVYFYVYLYNKCIGLFKKWYVFVLLLLNKNYSQILVIRTPIIRNYWVIRRRWTVPTFFSIIYCNKTTNYSNFGYPKNSIFRNDSSVPIEEVAIKLPFKIRSPKATHGDHDFFVWPSSIYTPE